MENYHPSKTPSPEEWLELDESLRNEFVLNSHKAAGIEFEEGAENIHSIIHVIVENQLAMKVEPVPTTIAKLTRQGLSRHEAIHAVGAVLSEDLFDIMKNGQKHNIKKYRKRLDKLTAKRWSKGKW